MKQRKHKDREGVVQKNHNLYKTNRVRGAEAVLGKLFRLTLIPLVRKEESWILVRLRVMQVQDALGMPVRDQFPLIRLHLTRDRRNQYDIRDD
jgi:hypothetical protein